MKNTLIAVLILLFSSVFTYSQNLYIKLGAGYAIGTSTELLTETNAENTIEGHYGSFGEGILPNLSLGYMFTNNVGVEIGGSYLIGKKFEHEHAETNVTETHKMWGEGILISPAIVLQAPMKSHTYYARFGGTIGLVKMKEEETESGDSARTGSDKFESSGNIGIGFNGAFGILFKAGNKLNIFIEVFGSAMSYGPKKKENTETYSGGTLEPTLNYEESFALNTSNTTLTPKLPFSNYGLNLGITYNFGKTVKKK